MKHKKTNNVLISERQFNAMSEADSHEEDSPSGSDVIENDETLMGINYMPDDPAEVIFNEEEVLSPEELASRAEETIS